MAVGVFQLSAVRDSRWVYDIRPWERMVFLLDYICASGIRSWYEWYTDTIRLSWVALAELSKCLSQWVMLLIIGTETTKELSRWKKPPLSITHTFVTQTRKPHTVCISLLQLQCFVCKQDITSHVIVLVQYQSVCVWDCERSLVYVCHGPVFIPVSCGLYALAC